MTRKRSPRLTPLCREIRELLTDIPRFWAVHGESYGGIGIEDAVAGTPAQQRNYRKLMAMKDRLSRLVRKLGRQRRHTKSELVTLILAVSQWWDGGHDGRWESMDVCDSDGPPGMLMDALLRSLCGIDPDKLADVWHATTPPDVYARVKARWAGRERLAA
jgi:hypothetical protein